MTENKDIQTASRLFTEGRYDEAEQLCAAMAARAPANGRVFYLYGLACYKNGKLEQSAAQFRQATILNPKDFDSLFNLGVACGELGQHEESISVYQTLLTKAPNYTKALPNLAQGLMKAGRYEDGADAFSRALAVNPKDSRTAALSMEFECLYRPMRERPSVCDKTLATPGLSPTTRFTAILYRATAEWAAQDLPALEKCLTEAGSVE